MGKWKDDLVFLLIIAALVGGWLYLYPRASESPLSPLDPPEDLQATDLPTYASQEGLALAYRLYEPPGEVGHVLVFLHDTLLHSGWYSTFARELAKEGIAVYLPDRRGWGYSEGDRQEVAEDKTVLERDIMAMVFAAQSRYPQKNIFVGAHGRGAGLVMRYVAARLPTAGVILVSPYISDDQPNLRSQGWDEMVSVHPGEAFLAQSGLVEWAIWHYGWPTSMTEADPMVESTYSIRTMEETVPDDVDAAYQALTAPLLCVQGAADPLFDPDRTAELMARFGTTDRQLETLPDAGYLTILDSAADPIARWLAGR